MPDIRTGQDLISSGIVPKDIGSHVALMTERRLTVLRDATRATVNSEMLGSWVPAITSTAASDTPTEITDVNAIRRQAIEGMSVRGRGTVNGQCIEGLEGKILFIDSRQFGITFERDLAQGSNLYGRLSYNSKQGLIVPLEAVTLLIPPEKPEPELAEGVVADKNLGHYARFGEEYQGDCSIEEDSGYSRRITRTSVVVPKHTTAMLYELQKNNSVLWLRMDSGIKDQGNRKYFGFAMSALENILQASSLGQTMPLDEEEEIRKQVLLDFFPTTILEEERAERLIAALLMKKDLCCYGPPGSGKSQVAKDIVSLAQQVGVVYVVEGCKVQCNPFSLFDPEFSKKVPPCPECMMKHDPNYRKTGLFNHPAPASVRVTTANFSEGRGIEVKEGTRDMRRMHLAGFKMPKLDGALNTDEFDPEGFSPGVLPRTNNGILVLEEMDKIPAPTLDNMLNALNDSEIQPDQLRFPYPANALVVGTANDHTTFPLPLVDRMLLFAIRYPNDVGVDHEVTQRGYHRKVVALSAAPLGDTHRMTPRALRDMLMPVIIERAVDAFYIKFRNEYAGAGRTDISGSHRSKFDALDASRALLVIDDIFYPKAPSIVTADYARRGIQFALCCRVQERTREKDVEAKKALCEFVAKEFLPVLLAEEKTWWCESHQHIAALASRVREVETNYQHELRRYPDIAEATHRAVKQEKDRQALLPAHVTKEYPFMAYLFDVQPCIENCTPEQVKELLNYLIQAKKRSEA